MYYDMDVLIQLNEEKRNDECKTLGFFPTFYAFFSSQLSFLFFAMYLCFGFLPYLLNYIFLFSLFLSLVKTYVSDLGGSKVALP